MTTATCATETPIFVSPTETIDIPIEVVDGKPCSAGYSWCDGEDCNDETPEDAEDGWEPDVFHSGVVAWLHMLRFTRRGWKDLGDVSLIVRHDENEGDDSQPLVRIHYPYSDSGPAMTPEQARINAAWLMNAADILDPLPAGVMVTTAVNVRIGDELLTGDGWQTVNGLVVDGEVEFVTIFTPEENLDAGNGWDFSFNDPVKVRRPLHGSCAIQFVAPIAGAVA